MGSVMLRRKIMKTKAKIFFFLLILIFSSQINSEKIESKLQVSDSNTIINALNDLSLHFVENKGQVNEKVKYHFKMPKGNVYLTPAEIVYQFFLIENKKSAGEEMRSGNEEKRFEDARSANIRVKFIESNDGVEVAGIEELEAKVSYFRGNDPKKWSRGARTFNKVLYKELYPQIDLLVFGNNKGTKHEYWVKPGGEVSNIRVKYENAKNLKINKKGQLEIDTGEFILLEDIPVSYQNIEGQRVDIETKYIIEEDNTVSFQVKDYRRDKELVIDPWFIFPFLIYQTYLGGSASDQAYAIAYDNAGNAYVTGRTYSGNFPLSNAYQTTTWFVPDAFVTKLNPNGTGLVYSTYLGGIDMDEGRAIAVDGSGNAFISGYTESTPWHTGLIVGPFPTTIGAYQEDYNEQGDAFVTCLDSTGTNLIYSTYLGGSGRDEGNGIKVDASGHAYVTGKTWSSNFPKTGGAYDTTYGTWGDAFITKFNSTGSGLYYSTFLGGSGGDEGAAIALDSSGNAYVTGWTTSPGFPYTSNAFDKTLSISTDAFVTKINNTGASLLYSSFLGGNGTDKGEGIAVDGHGDAYVTGTFSSSDFPYTADAYDKTLGGSYDAFIAKFNPSGSGSASLAYATYFGGNNVDGGKGIAIDALGNTYIAGYTNSTNLPNSIIAFGHNGGNDAFAAVINIPDKELLYVTYLGGSSDDWGEDIAVDSFGSAYVTGWSLSGDMYTTMATFNGVSDAFITKIFFLYLAKASQQLPIFDGHDFKNNGSSDVSVFRPLTGEWWIKDYLTVKWGTLGDIPVNGYYDADTKTDIAVWRPSNGYWYIKDQFNVKWGLATDIPVPGDYNGDGRTDIAMWRPTNGYWYVKDQFSVQWGLSSDVLVPGDYNGDGKTDIAVWRPTNGKWYIKDQTPVQWGLSTDVPVPGDYNGDGKTDIAMWRPSNGYWYIKDQASIQWGVSTDIPVPGDYNGDGKTDVAVWRPVNGYWYVKGQFNVQWGLFFDVPLVRK